MKFEIEILETNIKSNIALKLKKGNDNLCMLSFPLKMDNVRSLEANNLF